MLEYPLKSLAIILGSIVAAWLLTWAVVVPEKNEQLATKQGAIDFLNTKIAASDKENDKLTKQNEALRNYRAQDVMPLKKTALILASQIHELIKNWKDTDDYGTHSRNVQNFQERFGLRTSVMRGDLDQNGQHSDSLDKAVYNFIYEYKDVRIIADEIERLANNLPNNPNEP